MGDERRLACHDVSADAAGEQLARSRTRRHAGKWGGETRVKQVLSTILSN